MHPSSEDLRVLLETSQVPGIQDVRSVEDGISVVFPEADFVISMSSPAAGSALRHRVGGHRARAAAGTEHLVGPLAPVVLGATGRRRPR